MKKRIHFLIGILALLFTLGAIGKAQDPKPNAEIIKSTEKIVKGQPFSADAISESVQMMFDGNKIIRSVKTRMFRDSEGRFRREESAKPVGIGSYVETPSSILILDPVLGVKFVMNPESKTARQSELKNGNNKENLFKKRQEERGKRQEEREKQLKEKEKEQERQEKERERQVKERERQEEKRWEENNKQEEKRQVENDKRQDKIDSKIEEVNKKINEKQAEINAKIAAKLPKKPKTPTMPKPSKNSLMPGFPDGEVKNESLGTRKIEGVDAEGIRLTKTIAAGVIGNERSFDIVYERWYSKDLELIVFSKYTDPRFGEQTYKLINIRRAEPDSELFKLPADYTIVNKPSSIEIKPKPPEKRKAEFVYGQ